MSLLTEASTPMPLKLGEIQSTKIYVSTIAETCLNILNILSCIYLISKLRKTRLMHLNLKTMLVSFWICCNLQGLGGPYKGGIGPEFSEPGPGTSKPDPACTRVFAITCLIFSKLFFNFQNVEFGAKWGFRIHSSLLFYGNRLLWIWRLQFSQKYSKINFFLLRSGPQISVFRPAPHRCALSGTHRCGADRKTLIWGPGLHIKK